MCCERCLFVSARFVESTRYETQGAWVLNREGGFVLATAGEAGAEYIGYRELYPEMQKFLIEWCGYEFDEEAQDIGYWVRVGKA